VYRGLRFVDIVTLQYATTLEAARERFRGRTPASLELFRQLAEGTQYLHAEHGLAHMDIKPANVLLDACCTTAVVSQSI
jgi:serine/threonine protein kinase